VAHGDRRTSKVVGRRVEELHLPSGTTIDALVRGDEVIIAHHDTVIEADDHVILFLADKRNARGGEAVPGRRHLPVTPPAFAEGSPVEPARDPAHPRLLLLFSVTMLPPLAVSLWYDDGSSGPFAAAFAIILGLGLACWLPL
jgi:hypothetical protein